MANPAAVEAFDFPAWERRQSQKHEYLGGVITAMAGGSLVHGQLSLQAGALLLAGFGPRGCRAFSSDVMVAIGDGGFVYPDVSVACGAPDSRDGASHTLANPHLVGEVLSPTSLERDLIAKFEAYRRIPTLQHILYIHQDEPRVEHRQRTKGGLWTINSARGLDEVLVIDEFSLFLAELYRGVEFAPEPPIPEPPNEERPG